jgi:putative ABC transport system permease protein
MIYALRAIWFDGRRYAAGVMAVAFSAILIAVQIGLLIGLIGVVTVPIYNSQADLWVMFPETPACDLARPIPRYWLDRVWSQPGVIKAEEFIQNFTHWRTRGGESELVILLGCGLADDSIGPTRRLTAEQKALLTEPGSVILDRRDAKRVGVKSVGDEGEILGQRVRCVGFVDDMGSLSGPYVLCSIPTARNVLKFRDDQTTYLLARFVDRGSAVAAAARLNGEGKLTARLADDFAERSKAHWIIKTNAGLALGFAAALGLTVGALITSQTLYGAISASLRELAVLRALGISRVRMGLFVMQLALIVGLTGLAAATPAALGLIDLIRSLGAKAELPIWLLAATAGLTLGMAMLAGVMSLRGLRGVEPMELLR